MPLASLTGAVTERCISRIIAAFSGILDTMGFCKGLVKVYLDGFNPWEVSRLSISGRFNSGEVLPILIAACCRGLYQPILFFASLLRDRTGTSRRYRDLCMKQGSTESFSLPGIARASYCRYQSSSIFISVTKIPLIQKRPDVLYSMGDNKPLVAPLTI